MIVKLISTGLLSASIFYAGQACAASYAFTDLGSNSAASAINNTHAVAGQANSYATLWSNGAASGVTLPGGTGSVANAINDVGAVAGSSPDAGGVAHAALWNGATVSNLDTSATWSTSFATAINAQNQVAGFGYGHASDGSPHAAMWTNGTALDLGTLTVGKSSFASGINNAGIVVGNAYASDDSNQAVMWNSSGVMIDLGNAGVNSSAAAVNTAGLVVGFATATDNFDHATAWNITSDGIVNSTVLGILAGSDASYASAVNGAGTVVGYSVDTDQIKYATIWNGTMALDINQFLDSATKNAGWVLTSATGINDLGSIVGIAENSVSGAQHAFLLTVSAVPEPESYAMLLAGLCLMGSLTHRSRRSNKVSRA